MSSANQQNKSLLRTVVNFALLAGITTSFAGACVSSSDNKAAGGSSNGGESATGGAGNGGESTNGGGKTSTGGIANAGGSTNAASGCTAASATESGTLFLPTEGAIFNDFADCAGFGKLSPGTIQTGLYVYMNQTQADGGVAYLTTSCDATAKAVTISGPTDGSNYYGFGFWVNGNPGDAGTPVAYGLNASAYGGITFTISGTDAAGAGPTKQLTVGLKALVNGKVLGIKKIVAVSSTVSTITLKWSDFSVDCGLVSDFNPGKILYVWAAFDHSTTAYPINITVGSISFIAK